MPLSVLYHLLAHTFALTTNFGPSYVLKSRYKTTKSNMLHIRGFIIKIIKSGLAALANNIAGPIKI